MAIVRRFDPFHPISDALTLHDAMNQLFAQSFVQPEWSASRSASLAAPIDVFEMEQTYHVQVLLPGVKPEDIELTAQGNTLTFKGQFQPYAKQDKQVTWLAQEIGSGSFERSVTFPKPIDIEKIETQYQHGLLMITVPIHESTRPKRISVTGSESQQVAIEAGKR